MENYKNVSQDIRDQMNAEAEAVQIILTGIDNDIYSTVDACPNACEMWKAIERLKQGESINVQDLETIYIREFGIFTLRGQLYQFILKHTKPRMAKNNLQTFQQQHPNFIKNHRVIKDNSPRINRGTGYDNQRAINVVGARENVEEAGVQLMPDKMLEG
ncbi:hypothetical protein Tco_1186501 [Tanacetum coccineum]